MTVRADETAARWRHLPPLALFALLTVAWTWPLALHLTDAIPGDPGDNYSFLWNLWWMRHVMATPGLEYFRTTALFHPFGTTIVNHPHTALPALISATVLKGSSIVAAQNVLVLVWIFCGMAATYALVWEMTAHRRAAILAGVLFGTSPYLAVHLLGHFDLLAAWVLPAFALFLRRAVQRRSTASTGAAVAAGVVLAVAAYTAYYYVVYIGLFMVVYLTAWTGAVAVTCAPRPVTSTRRRVQRVLVGLMLMLAVAAAWIAMTGGGTVRIGALTVSTRTPQNLLTAMWVVVLGWAVYTWRVSFALEPTSRIARWDALRTAALVAAVFLVLASPLLWQAARLIARGEYVTQRYGWRSAPHGVDLAAPLFGHPRHPLFEIASRRVYAAAQQDIVEAVGWVGIVPPLLLLFVRPSAATRRETLAWTVVALAFAIWALGPFLTIGGFDTGLKLPEILARFFPFVENARMPGRAMVGVYLAMAVLIGLRLQGARDSLATPLVQWALIAAIAFEYWDAPIRLTPLGVPAVYRALAAAPPGPVCEVPLGIGDGLSPGIGSQDRSILFYATVHEHPIVGGFIGRMPADAAHRYEEMPMVGDLLRLSDGGVPAGVASGDAPVCRYLVVNRPRSSASLLAYVHQLPLDLMASDDGRELYRVR